MGRLVALGLPGGAAYAEAIQCIWDAGDAIAPLDDRLPKAELERVMATLKPGAVIEADGEIRSLAGGEPVEPGDGLVIATSGTSGEPKAVIHTHKSIEASALAIGAALNVDTSSDRWLACLPLAHIGGLAVVMRSLVTGTDVEVHNGFDADAVIRAAQNGATLTSMVTRALNQVPAELFRTVLIGGAAPPPDRPKNVIATYGLTETGSGVVYDSVPLEGLEVSIGPPSPNPDGQTPAAGGPASEAEIYLRGAMLFRGYRSLPDPFVDGGWFPTGDLGFHDADGRLHVSGRRGDVIKTGGEMVWPEPVERLLLSRDDIEQVAIIGRPDPDWGHRVVAVVVVAEGHSEPELAELREAVVAELPMWNAPKELQFVADIPRTSLGKVRRNLL
ncbi:MAG: class I adenylate-forming enzyme family protein [Acidimicrobiales bacterium]